MNDGRVDLGADLTLYVSVGGFSTSDPSETASLAIGGQGVVAGSRLVIADGDHAGTYTPPRLPPGPMSSSFQVSRERSVRSTPRS